MEEDLKSDRQKQIKKIFKEKKTRNKNIHLPISLAKKKMNKNVQTIFVWIIFCWNISHLHLFQQNPLF